MNRKELKKHGFEIFKRNYLKIILVVFIVGVVVNGGYQYSSVISDTASTINRNEKLDNIIVDNGYKITKVINENTINVYGSNKSNYEIVNDLVDTLSNKISVGGHNNGVIGSFFNSVTKSNSVVIGSLNAINLYLLNNRIDIIYISLIGIVLIVLIKLFFLDVFKIGYKRFFLEQRRYNTNISKILFPFQIRKFIHIGLIIFIKNIYQFLWSLTIIFAPIKHYEYYMIPYILAENPNIKRKDAFHLSKELMRGYKWEMFKLELSFLPWMILNIFTFGLFNIFFLEGYKESVLAESYIYIRAKKINVITNNELLNDKYLDVEKISNTEYPMDKFSIPSKEFHIKINTHYDVKYSIRNYILMFFIFAFIGWSWEVLLHLVSEGRFVNRGTMFGPWLPIYGVGALMILIVLKPLRKRPVLFFVSAMILAGIVEYFTAWYLWEFKGAKWWDYTGYFLNIHGRVCLEGLLVFGFGGAAVTYFIGPSLNSILNKIKPKISVVICSILLLFFGIDFIYSMYNPNTGDGITDYNIPSEIN